MDRNFPQQIEQQLEATLQELTALRYRVERLLLAVRGELGTEQLSERERAQVAKEYDRYFFYQRAKVLGVALDEIDAAWARRVAGRSDATEAHR